MDEIIKDKVYDLTEAFFEENDISGDNEMVFVEAFPVGDAGALYIISYNEETIGSVLRYKDEITVTTYYTKGQYHVIN